MFDIGFSELLVIGVIALIVIGPERLPKVARTVGSLLGRLNRYVNQVKQDVERDIHLDELRKTQQSMQETAQRFEIMAEETGSAVKSEVAEVERSIGAAVEPETKTDETDADERHTLLSEVDEPERETRQAQLELQLDSEPSDASKGKSA